MAVSTLLLFLILLTTEASGWTNWCWPKLWEGKIWTLHIMQTDQGCDVWESTAAVTVDLVGNRLASREAGVRNGKQYNVFYLFYYPANTVYIVENDRCETHPIAGNVSQHCIDFSDINVLEYLKEYLGYAYDNGAFAVGLRGIKDGVEYFHSVDPEDSIPLIEEQHGTIDGVPTYTVRNYYNITLGISDVSVFTPPEICI